MESLGCLVWYVAADDASADLAGLRQAFEQDGLDASLLPEQLENSNALRTATHRRDWRYELGDGMVASIDVRDDPRTNRKRLVRAIQRTVLADGKPVHSDRIGEIVLDRPLTPQTTRVRERMRVHTNLVRRLLSDPEQELLDAELTVMRAEYERLLAAVDATSLRRIGRRYLLRQLNAVRMTERLPLWFVAEDHADELARFTAALDAHAERLTLGQALLVDLPAHRTLVSEAAIGQALEFARQLDGRAHNRDRTPNRLCADADRLLASLDAQGQWRTSAGEPWLTADLGAAVDAVEQTLQWVRWNWPPWGRRPGWLPPSSTRAGVTRDEI